MKTSKTLSRQEALQRCAALCSTGEHCAHELEEKMRRWGLCNADIEKNIIYLYDEKYIDNDRFCHAYSRDKMRYNRWGKRRIIQELRMLRLPSSCIQEAIDDLPADEYLEQLSYLLETKKPSIKASSDYERNGKLIRFALGRGFEMNLICQLLHATAEDYDTDVTD